MAAWGSTSADRRRRRSWRTVLAHDHLVVLAGSVLLVVAGFLAEGRAGDAAGARADAAGLRAERAALTDEALRDAYGFRAPYALRWFVAQTRTTALAEEVVATGDSGAAGQAGDFLLADSVTMRVTEPIAAPLRDHDFQAAAYMADAAGGTLTTGGRDPGELTSEAEQAERGALRLRFVTVVLALAVTVAGVASLVVGGAHRSVVHGSWVLLAGGTALLLVEVAR